MQPSISQADRREIFLEAANLLGSMSADHIRLHAGEMTAQEMRTVQAVLQWQAREMMRRAHIPKEIPSLLQQEWTTEEMAAAGAFMTAMGNDLTIFGRGSGCGRFMHCIRAALMEGRHKLADDDPRVAAAADWLRFDDSAYEEGPPDVALRAAREMLSAADAVDPLRAQKNM